jgi:F-type H+-transporting ATPase subunit a
MEQFELYPVFGSIPSAIFFMMVATAIGVGALTLKAPSITGNWWSTLNESLYHTLLAMTRDYIGPKLTPLFPLIFTLFHFILFCNLIGLVPSSSTPTVEIVITLTAAITLLAGILLLGFMNHGTKLLAAFIPSGTPFGLIPLMILLELLAYVTRTLSLGLRLAVNMITGHILCKVVVGFIWAMAANHAWLLFTVAISLITLFISLEILIAYLQAYIFTFITCLTIKDIVKSRIGAN